jgi:hypothetical protein
MALGAKLEGAAKEMGEGHPKWGEMRGRNHLAGHEPDRGGLDDRQYRAAAQMSLGSAKNVLELEERTRRIDKIVDAIVMVTVQTRMLAVNGNVEAARAGEFGRGFSVVAGDIRSLANESSENADRIKDLVKSIQGQITKVVTDIEGAGIKAKEPKPSAPRSRPRTWRRWPRTSRKFSLASTSLPKGRRSGGGAAAGVQGQRADCYRLGGDESRQHRVRHRRRTGIESGAGNSAGGRRNRFASRRTPARIGTMT